MPVDAVVDPTTTLSQAPPAANALPPLYGVIALTVAAGVEWMITAFVAWGRLPKDRSARNLFSARAWSLIRPERDLQIYAAGIVLTLLFIAASCFGWFRLSRRRAAAAKLKSSAVTQVALAIAGLITFLCLLHILLPMDAHDRRPVVEVATGAPLVLVGIATFVLAAIDFSFDISDRNKRLLAWAGPILMALSILAQLRLAPIGLDIAVLVLLAALSFRVAAARRKDIDQWRCHGLRRSAALAATAIAVFAIYLGILTASDSSIRSQIPVFSMVLCILVDVWTKSKKTRTTARWRVDALCDTAVPLLLCATIFVPHSQWSSLSIGFLKNDELHHWNYFALGPALAFAHGRSLVTEVYSQYGVAWPYLFAVLRHAVKLSYANLLGYSVIYGCSYLIAIYLFLRLLLRDAAWAACGAILAATVQIFSGIGPEGIIWNFPSSTMLRDPMDVWCFLALLIHSRSDKRRWFALAGAICGVAVLFELDTGIELLIVLCFYWLLYRICQSNLLRLRTWDELAPLLGAAVAALTVWLAGMALASRGTILHRAFWSEYVEGLHNQAFSGLSLLPIANVDGYGIALFAVMLIVYFFAIGTAAARIWLKANGETDLFLAVISSYGLGLLLLFVGRSHPLNLFHPMVPFVLVVALLLHRFNTTAAGGERPGSLRWILVGASLAMLWSKPEFLRYPSLLKAAFIRPADQNVASMNVQIWVGNAAISLSDHLINLREVAKAIQNLPASDGNVAVLDDRDTFLDLLADRAPWSRYTSLFHGLLTQKLISDCQQQLSKEKPQFIVIRSAPPDKWDFTDTWAAFHHLLPRHYRLEKTVGAYDFWRRVQ